ncbi:O-antigen ligase family protein [Planctomycetaceae bacterium]|nr:O-antigen ligase family protein [Planctomycetaceae bacterium]
MPEMSRPAAASEAHPDQSPAWLAIAISLLVARWLLPAESTVTGSTLWLVGGWLLLALTWALSRLRAWHIAPLNLDRFDLAVALLVFPQIVSALLLIVASDGNARAAANMGCEWIALLVSFVLLRRWLPHRIHFQAILRVAWSVAVGISILGIWQHHVGYQQSIADFDRLETQLATAIRNENNSEARQLQSELVAAGIPLDGPARQLWERRLRDSREPYGFFALANTLGGFLAPLLLVGLAHCPTTWRSWRRWPGRPRTRLTLFLAGLILVAYCLLLTKSRTAWIGFTIGGMVLVGENLWNWLREHPGRTALAAALPVLSVAIVLATGGIDREVLTEAPKSLAYRFEYWQGTLGVISTRPLIGTGPGNFRQHYLAHKLEGSSEEIADPHNFVLEATATAGLLGLTGLIACVVLLLRGRHGPTDDPTAKSLTGNYSTGILLLGGAGGFVLALAPGWLLGGILDNRLLSVLASFVVAGIFLPAMALDGRLQRRVSLAATVAILIHLSAAGGFGRPAVMQLVLLMTIGWLPAPGVSRLPNQSTDTAALRAARLTAMGCGLLFILVCVCGLLPVFKQSTSQQVATNALLSGRRAQAARLLTEAQHADPLDPTPTRRLTSLRIDMGRLDSAPADFSDRAIRAGLDTVQRDPHNWSTAHDLARGYRLRWQRDHGDDDRREVIKWGTTAVNRYPSNPRLHAWLARTLDEIGQEQSARDQARETLRLHHLLEQRGHVDKLLSDEHLEEMKALLAVPETTIP